jgi:hypothetical protein
MEGGLERRKSERQKYFLDDQTVKNLLLSSYRQNQIMLLQKLTRHQTGEYWIYFNFNSNNILITFK